MILCSFVRVCSVFMCADEYTYVYARHMIACMYRRLSDI